LLASGALAACILLFARLAAAQETTPAQRPSPPPAASNYQPGLLEGVGRWFKDSFSRPSPSADGARGTLGGWGGRAGVAAKEAAVTARQATDAAKDAADVVARLPNARVVEARARCIIAANGAPDCRTAARSVCKAKGFGSGASLEIQATQKCPARVWLSGRAPDPGECAPQAILVRAVCQ
jgi:hypothetical protein